MSDEPRSIGNFTPEGTGGIKPAAGRKRGSVAAFASTSYASTALGLLTAPIVARTLGAEGRGEYAAVMAYSALVATVLSLGVTNSVSRALLGERREPRMVMGACIRFALYTVPSAALGAAIVAETVFDDLSATARLGAIAFTAIVPIAILQLCLNSFMLSSGALGSLMLIRAAPLVVNAVGVVGLAVAGMLSLATYLGVTLAGVALTFALSLRVVGIRPASGGEVRPLLRFGVRAYPATMANLANAQLDQMLIAPFLGPADLGRYAVAVTMSNLPLGFVQALGARFQSEMTDSHGELIVEAVANRVRISGLVGLLGALALAPVIPFLVPLLFGSDFTQTIPLCLVLLLAAYSQGVMVAAGPALILADRPGAASTAQLVGLAVTILGLAVLLPTVGIMGASIATVLAYVSRGLVMTLALRRLGVVELRPRRSDLTAIWDTLPRRK